MYCDLKLEYYWMGGRCNIPSSKYLLVGFDPGFTSEIRELGEIWGNEKRLLTTILL